MTPFDYKYLNPLRFACLMLIIAIFIFTPLGIQNLNMKLRKANWILVVLVKWRNHESCLLCVVSFSKINFIAQRK